MQNYIILLRRPPFFVIDVDESLYCGFIKPFPELNPNLIISDLHRCPQGIISKIITVEDHSLETLRVKQIAR